MIKKIPSAGFYLFKSCFIGLEYPGAESSTRFVFDKLGIDYYDDPRQSCCTGMGMNVDAIPPLPTAALAARNFTLANQVNHPYFATICSTCYGVNKEACEWMTHTPQLYTEVKNILAKVGLEVKKEYLKPENVYHACEVLYEWRNKITDHVVVDFKDVRIATHHGCHFYKLFPEAVVGDPESIQVLDELVKVIGADSISWYAEKNYCCGSGFRHRWLSPELARAAAYDKLVSVKQVGAEILVNMCPMCAFQFDRSDALLEKYMGAKLGIIHLNIAQLIALSMGADPYKVVGVQTHSVKVEPILKKLKII
ncbi:MAG TPA: CoB--CoM heterodisulfide reductase iron-sulfur subunit B family protein [Candidatus Deferrimicrobium sp.]|nr:CoB--CoM heterodisulfide reductase iron-sulfur subunit B family protein [Candidatus Deferrimicrobium sp.]